MKRRGLIKGSDRKKGGEKKAGWDARKDGGRWVEDEREKGIMKERAEELKGKMHWWSICVIF